MAVGSGARGAVRGAVQVAPPDAVGRTEARPAGREPRTATVLPAIAPQTLRRAGSIVGRTAPHIGAAPSRAFLTILLEAAPASTAHHTASRRRSGNEDMHAAGLMLRRTRREKGVPVARGASGDGLAHAALGGQHLVIVSTCAEDCTERNGSEPHAPTRTCEGDIDRFMDTHTRVDGATVYGNTTPKSATPVFWTLDTFPSVQTPLMKGRLGWTFRCWLGATGGAKAADELPGSSGGRVIR